MSVVCSLRPRFSVDSEAVHACVFWMTPVWQHPHLDDLEGLVILLLEEKSRNIQNMEADCKLNRLRSVSSYHNREGLQWFPVIMVCVVPQQLPLFLVLIIQTLHTNKHQQKKKERHSSLILALDLQVSMHEAFFLSVCLLHKQWSFVGRWWCFQLGKGPWGCAPRRKMLAGSSMTIGSPSSLESLWTPSSSLDTHQAEEEKCQIKFYNKSNTMTTVSERVFLRS